VHVSGTLPEMSIGLPVFHCDLPERTFSLPEYRVRALLATFS